MRKLFALALLALTLPGTAMSSAVLTASQAHADDYYGDDSDPCDYGCDGGGY